MKQRLTIRRILVALDTSADSLAAAWTAAELAGLLKAELAGVFVEDEELVRLSRSPLAQQADLTTFSVRRLEDKDLEEQMQAQARRARQELARIAGILGVPWTFRVRRGRVSEEILQAASEADLVTLGRMGWSLRNQRRLGKTARQLLSRRRVRTLLMGPRRESRPPLAVIYDGSEAGHEALELGFQLAQASRSPLEVLLLGEDEKREPLQAEALRQAGRRKVNVRLDWLGGLSANQLARSVCSRSARLVLLPVGQSPPGNDRLEALLNETDCLVLAVS